MSLTARLGFPFRLALAAAALAGVTPARAKPPTLDGLFPAGARRGTTVAVKADGSFGHWPVRGWCSAPGVTVEPGKEKGTLSVTVADDAPPGFHWLRLADEEGATVARPFVVGTLPEVVESEPNDRPDKPQALDSSRVTVNGRLARSGDVDGYAVRLAKGETLVASLEANRHLGSPMDGVLQLVSPAGFVIAQNDDEHGNDPQLVVTAPADGTYLVRTFAFPASPDSSIRFSGSSKYVYRLTLTTGGFLDHVRPLAVARDGPRRVEASGWNVPEAARSLEIQVGEDDRAGRAAHPELGNTAEVRVVPHPVATEAEPNDLEHPQAITPPASVGGRIDPARDVDAYAFPAKKGEAFRLRVESRALGQPLDPVLRVLDAAGKVLAEADDSNRQRDAELRFTAPADGTYRALVRDLNDQGGFRYAYVLTVAGNHPDVALTLAADQFTLKPGATLDVPVAVARADGYDQAVTVSLADAPEGVTAAAVTSEPKGPTSKTVTLKLSASEGAASGTFRVVGKPADGPPRVAIASNAILDVWLTVARPDPKAKPAK